MLRRLPRCDDQPTITLLSADAVRQLGIKLQDPLLSAMNFVPKINGSASHILQFGVDDLRDWARKARRLNGFLKGMQAERC
jgi:hypothetical protein